MKSLTKSTILKFKQLTGIDVIEQGLGKPMVYMIILSISIAIYLPVNIVRFIVTGGN